MPVHQEFLDDNGSGLFDVNVIHQPQNLINPNSAKRIVIMLLNELIIRYSGFQKKKHQAGECYSTSKFLTSCQF